MIQEQGKVRKRLVQALTRFFERGLFAPFLLSIQPVLHLFLINIGELDFSEVIRPILLSFLFGSVVLGVVYVFIRNWLKAGLIASLFLLLFFLFGDMADWTSAALGLGIARRHLLILAFATLCMIAWIWLVQTRIRNIASVNLFFNLLSLLFLINSGIQMRNHLVANGISLKRTNYAVPVAAVEPVEPRPDIYYIILDGYGRKDILQALYQFDNSDFLNALQVRGFYVAEESSSNYIQTMLSLSSSLNMDYLQALRKESVNIEGRGDLIEILEHSKVRIILAQNGYRLVSFQNEYKATIPDAEIYYDDAQAGLAYPVTAFESILINHTMLRVLSHLPAFNEALIGMPYAAHRGYILSTFAKLQEIPAMDGDYFVYAHIIAPHPPFVFGENGEVLPQDEPFTLSDANYYIKDHSRKSYIAGYRKQIQYVNTLVLETVDAILARSETAPIIIIQGDHGPGAYLHWGELEQTWPAERFGILNAYYFAGQDNSSLYPSISPVNSFRVLFNQFFGGNYALIPDQHYYSSWSFPFDFIEVTDLSLP